MTSQVTGRPAAFARRTCSIEAAVDRCVRWSRAAGTSRDDLGEERDVARDGARFGRGRPTLEPEHRRDQPVVRLGAGRQGELLRVLDERQPEHAGVGERVPEQLRVLDRRAVVAEPDDPGVGELRRAAQAAPLPARAVAAP